MCRKLSSAIHERRWNDVFGPLNQSENEKKKKNNSQFDQHDMSLDV